MKAARRSEQQGQCLCQESQYFKIWDYGSMDGLFFPQKGDKSKIGQRIALLALLYLMMATSSLYALPHITPAENKGDIVSVIENDLNLDGLGVKSSIIKTMNIKDDNDGHYHPDLRTTPKSSRTLEGRLFHHKKGTVNDNLLSEGDKSYTYFNDALVVLFDNNGKFISSVKTDSTGHYKFTVNRNQSYRIAVDAATLTPGDHDFDEVDTYPEQTWTGPGGPCADGSGGITERETGDFCYGGKTQGKDWLRQKRQDKSCNSDIKDVPDSCFVLNNAEHIIRIPADRKSYSDLNFGFSYDVVTHTTVGGQGSLLNFILATNYNKGPLGTGQMLFVPAFDDGQGGRWKINWHAKKTPLALDPSNASLDGQAYDLLNPEQALNCGSSNSNLCLILGTTEEVQDLKIPVVTLNGTNQSVSNIELVASKNELIRLTANSNNATITNNFFNATSVQGVSVLSKESRITKNRFKNTVVGSVTLPIDLGADNTINANTGGYAQSKPNKGIDRPIIESYTRDTTGDQIIITGHTQPGTTVEFYQVNGNDYQFLFEATEGEGGEDLDDGKSTFHDPVSNQPITQNRFQFAPSLSASGLPPTLAAIAIDSEGNTSEFSPEVQLSGTIKATLWHDLDRNGKQEPNEPVLPDIELVLSETNRLTNKKGEVYFRSLPAGNYQVEVLPNQGGLDGLVLETPNPQDISIDELKTYNLSFGYVTSTEKAITLTPEHNKSTAPGLFVHFPHTLTSDSGGPVTLTAQWLNDEGQPNDKATANWPVILKQLPSCKIEEKRSTEESSSTLELTLTPKESACFQASFFVPAETPQGVRGSLEITATTEVDGELTVLASVTDQITVSDGGSGRLKLQKWVQNNTLSESNSTSNNAGSGDILTYTIQFRNIGVGPLTDLNIMDDTPAFTVLSQSVQCPRDEDLPMGLGRCELILLGGNNTAGFSGRIIWRFDGTLQPGAEGEVSYELMVE